MKRITLRNSVIAGAAAVAMVATGSLAAPTEAQAGNGKLVGAFLGGYIILYGQVQSWTPQLVTGPLNQT